MSGRSGWCSPAPGTVESVDQHAECERRQADGLIGPCDCPEHPAATTKEDAA
jgi:hypothetical protein